MRAAACFVALLVIAVAVFLVAPGYSYLPDLTGGNGGVQPSHWDFSSFPVQWNLNPSAGHNISGSRSVADVMTAAFATWVAAPNTVLQVSRGPDASVSDETNSPSNVNLICFVCTGTDFTKDAQTLAVTITTTADNAGGDDGHGGATRFAGQIIKSDIIFNPATTFTTGGGSGQDLLTVATHEVGHFFGMDHSPVVRAVMFPSASNLTTLSWDDVAGISQLYPKSNADVATGSISGTVTKNGSGVFGAHVFAQPTSDSAGYGGSIRMTPVGTLTAPDGSYVIRGLPPGSYDVGAEPLDGPVSSSDVSGYPKAYGQPSLATSFTTRMH